jgi:hypothetical protein
MNMQITLSLRITFILAFSATLGCIAIFAQEKGPLNHEWLQKDIEGVAALMKLMPVEKQNMATLKESLEEEWSVDDERLGFNANRIAFRKGYGYCSIYADVFTFKGDVGYYEVGVSCSSEEWTSIRDSIITAWKQHESLAFTEAEAKLSYQKRFEDVFSSYYRAVADELGEMKPVDVPAQMKDAYEYLTSPMNNSYVGEGACGYGGSIPEGKSSMDTLVDSRRIDLLENILRGYNPGGRVYAAIALSRKKKKGMALSQETLATLEKVINLDVPISTCSGCLVNGGLTAKDVIEEFVKK